MGMNNILVEPEGSDITVYGVYLYNQFKFKNEGKDDTLFIVYKDAQNNKKVRQIKNPSMEIFFTKPEYRTFKTPREYIEIDKTYAVTVPARQVISKIAEEIRQSDDQISQIHTKIYNNCRMTGNYQAMKNVLKWPYTHMSDMSVEDYYRVMLGYHYNTMRSHIIDKCYLDIESDVYGLTSSQAAANKDKTNACTLIFNYDQNRKEKKSPEVYTFLLRNYKRYPQQKHFEEHLDEFLEECHKMFDKQTVIKSGKEQLIDVTASYDIQLFDKEADLLQAIFTTINTHRPDTLSVWNIAYDIPKLAARMEHNGLSPIDTMCDSSFPKEYRFLDFHIDNRPGLDISNRNTFIRMASTTCYIDQMQSYAGIRKGRKAYGSNKLDNIAKIELGMGKLEFENGVNVINACIKDYWHFVLYNIRDVWCQVLIDSVTNDSMSMVYDMNQANCALEYLTKQTRYQKQIYYTNYLRKGVVPGNNINVDYLGGKTEESMETMEELRAAAKMRQALDEDTEGGIDADDIENDLDDEDDDKFDETDPDMVEFVEHELHDIYSDSIHKNLKLAGGLVANPDFNLPNGTELIDGVHSKHMHDDVYDMDYASEYPWAKFTRSISRSTQIGRVIINGHISDRQNTLPMGQKKREADIASYLPGAEFIGDYISHDILSLGNVWFGLPSVEEADKLLFPEEDHRTPDGFVKLIRR